MPSSPPLALTLLRLCSRKVFVSEYASSPETAIPSLIRRIRRLSPPQQATLKALCQHLARVVEYEPVNKMTASNLGMIFSTVVFGEEEGTTLETLSHFKVHTLCLFEAMIARTDNNLIIGLDYGAAHQAAINSLRWLTYRTTSPRSVEKSERKPQQLRPTTFSSICAIHTIPAVSSIWRAQSVSECVCVECSKSRLDCFLLDRLSRAILTIST